MPSPFHDAQARAEGRFFIGNPSTTKVEYVLNGRALAPGLPCYPGPQPPPFTPRLVTAPLAASPEPGQLGYGTNRLEVAFLDEPQPEEPFTFFVSFSGSTHSLRDDVVSFVFRGCLVVTDARGFPLCQTPGSISAHLLSGEPDLDQSEPQRSNKMPGKVFVFNCFNETMTLRVQGEGVGPIPAWEKEKYTPQGIPVERCKKERVPGQFKIGENSVLMEWPSGPYECTVVIPGLDKISIEDPLVLFIGRDRAWLLNARGYVQGEFEVREAVMEAEQAV